MRNLFLRIGACALLFTVMSVGALSDRANAMAGSDRAHNAQRQDQHIRQGSTSVRKHRRRAGASGKQGQRTIIFVGGKTSKTGAATRSNPLRAKKSNGSLNPQPIPPGKQY